MGICFKPGDEEDVFFVERVIPFKIRIAPVENGDVAFFQWNGGSDLALMDFARGDHRKGGQISRMVQLHVQFDSSFGGAEFGPVIK